jgi:uncharacterized membrane protein
MRRELIILLGTCLVGEALISLIYQFIMQAPYSRFYLLIPLFFMGIEWIYYEIEQYARRQINQAKATQVYMLYKTAKLLLTLAIVLGLAFLLPEVGVAFFIRLVAMYLITLVVETKLAVAWMLDQPK